MKRNRLAALPLLLLLGTAASSPALAASPIDVAVNGQYVSFPDEPPYLDPQTDRTMVPVRFVAEELGLGVQWYGQSNEVTLAKKGETIRFQIGQYRAQLNGEMVAFDTPAVIRNNRTMVPLRFIGEAFHAQIDWVAERNLAVVTTPGHTKIVPASPPPNAAVSTPKLQQATWIWDAAIIQTSPDSVFTFASDHRLTAIYLQIDKDVPVLVYRDFVRKAKEKQIRVEALGGRPEWALPHYQDQIESFIAWVQSYNAAAGPKERFTGLHFDIEPYILAEWKTDNKRVIETWMNSMRFIEEKAKGSGMTLAFDVPFWLHMVKVPGSDYSMSAWLLEKADSVVIMDYRNVALGNDGIVANANAILREAATLKKNVIVAVETAPSSEGPMTSFHSLSAEAMEAELQKAKEKLSHFSSYAGFAVHDYKSWSKLAARSN